MTEDSQKDPDKEIIELSEIVVGTSEDDDAIVEMTEGLLDEARNGISGATGDESGDSRQMDLSRDPEFDFDLVSPENEIIELVEEIEPGVDVSEEEKTVEGMEPGNAEENARGAENGSDDILELTEEVEAVSERQLERALERVIEKRYGDMIDRVLKEVIWQKVSEDIEHLKQYLLSRNSEG
ncbi:MAG: hypothetical protein R6U41_07305 [Desulfosalsimonas sp.]|uniref:hypothetical protein n=1 Tax=Desulfosalsimonas sp. TaxID=3073848 RepID=UPI003970F601